MDRDLAKINDTALSVEELYDFLMLRIHVEAIAHVLLLQNFIGVTFVKQHAQLIRKVLSKSFLCPSYLVIWTLRNVASNSNGLAILCI